MIDQHIKLRQQIKAGRALLSMDQSQLAHALGMKHAKISRAENGETKSEDVLKEIQRGMEKLGIIFLPSGGVDRSMGHIEIIEGANCYVQLLGRIAAEKAIDELFIMFASDSVSPPEVNALYRILRKAGIRMRQLIRKGDTYIMGQLEEYRTISEKYFTNIVTVVYGNQVAQVSGDETRIVIYHDPPLAERERKVFSYFWDHGGIPEHSTADERF